MAASTPRHVEEGRKIGDEMDIEKREKLRSRLRSAKHLPEFMRDFHDQKDLFKTIQSVMETKNPETCGSVNCWASATASTCS